jgi:hypothetical protein
LDVKKFHVFHEMASQSISNRFVNFYSYNQFCPCIYKVDIKLALKVMSLQNKDNKWWNLWLSQTHWHVSTSPIKCEAFRVHNLSPFIYCSSVKLNQAMIPLLDREGETHWIESTQWAKNNHISDFETTFSPKILRHFEASDSHIISFICCSTLSLSINVKS